MNESAQRNILLKEYIPHKLLKEKNYRSEAAVVIVVNKLGQVLLIQENTDDPRFGRKKGQWNVVTETWRHNERLKQNFQAAIEEELGSIKELDERLFMIRGSYHEADFGPIGNNPSRAHVMIFRFMDDPEKLPFHPKDPDEITAYKWVDIKNISWMCNNNELAPSVSEYVFQLSSSGIICPYNEGCELHEKIQIRRFSQRPAGDYHNDKEYKS